MRRRKPNGRTSVAKQKRNGAVMTSGLLSGSCLRRLRSNVLIDSMNRTMEIPVPVRSALVVHKASGCDGVP